MSGAEPFVVSRVRPSHLTPLSRRWLSRLLLRLLLHRYQCQLHQELAACDVFVITGDSLQHPAPVPLHPPVVFLTTRIEKRFSSPLFVSFETSHAREGLFFRGTPDNSPP